MMKLLITLTLTLTSIFCLNGCSKDSETESASGEAKKVIGITVMDLGNPFFVELTNAAKAEAAKHGYDVIIYDGDAEEQSKQIKDFITPKVDAMIIPPKDALAIGAPIKEANKAGIPVFTADTGCDDKDAIVVCNVMSDNYGGGKLAAQGMIEALENKGGKSYV